MRIDRSFLLYAVLVLAGIPSLCFAKLDVSIIDQEMADHVEQMEKGSGKTPDDFNSCQITTTVSELPKTGPYSLIAPQEITLIYENHKITTLTSKENAEATPLDLGLNCVEFNKYVYVFFDTLTTGYKFNLPDASYVIFSSDSGESWSPLQSLNQFSKKEEFVLPSKKFSGHVKILGDSNGHAISIYNMRDETTYLFTPDFQILKSLSVYNRLSGFNAPKDFDFYQGAIYLFRGSCEMLRGGMSCPGLSYLETSKDYGKTWHKISLPYFQDSRVIVHDDVLYHFYREPCPSGWLGFLPALDRSPVCGLLKMQQLNSDGAWAKPKTLLKTVSRLKAVYPDEMPLIVWEDYRFYATRLCGFIPLVGCVDSISFIGPNVTYAGKLDLQTMSLRESIIKYDAR